MSEARRPERALAGRVALVTGSARGLGAGMALSLAAAGARVAFHYRHSEAQAQELAEGVRRKGGEAQAFQADLRRWEEVAELRRRLLEQFGRLDILVNNVGDFIEKPLAETTPEEWEEMLASNLTTVFYTCRAFWADMVQQRYGRIINIGLAGSDRAQAYSRVVPYAIAKNGVLILTRSLAVEGAPSNITVNLLAPGLMDNGSLDAAGAAAASARVPAGRPGTAADLSAALLFLCSDAAAYITGSQIPVSGGWGL